MSASFEIDGDDFRQIAAELRYRYSIGAAVGVFDEVVIVFPQVKARGNWGSWRMA